MVSSSKRRAAVGAARYHSPDGRRRGPRSPEATTPITADQPITLPITPIIPISPINKECLDAIPFPVVAGVAAAGLLLTACGSGANPAATVSSAASAASSAASNATASVKVGMAYDVGGRGDQSFNDAAAAGMDKAKADLGVATTESTATAGEAESAREERLNTLIDQGYTAIVAVGFAYAPSIKKVAPANPDVKFALVDSTDASGPSVQNIVFAEEQGSYLAGYAAALKSKSNTVGFVGGVQTDLIKKFEAGFVAGAKAAKPNVKVLTKYLTQPPDFKGFASPALGKTAADGMLSAGADVIYHASGGSGSGVFTAVKAKPGAWAIGVDSDQAKTADPKVRDIILTSMVKKLDVGVYEFIKQSKDGSFKAGPAAYDLKSDGVALATTGDHLNDIMPKLDAVKQEIVAGTVKVPSKP
ncbi:MAG: BMP family ABC transporter substrate-binding protein [Austwickia sp.]|nr:BMP family ABC transporter substrate-binding protein [Austwickia sp.]MBK8436760.1 BMP family ABC transporter substrate-binding protein [Austwickia sp.]MBK9100391.1 BMP family ABC transporter substrate-binding protein [Austwickia sp.]